ncbi:hypothetical protein GCM10027161_34420 [Microbispora hainanensis]
MLASLWGSGSVGLPAARLTAGPGRRALPGLPCFQWVVTGRVAAEVAVAFA